MNNLYQNSANDKNGLNDLVQRLQKEDIRNLQMFKRFKWINLVLMVFYALFFIFNPFLEIDLSERIAGICYGAAFGIMFLIFRLYNKEYVSIDYSLAFSETLKKAAERYALTSIRRILLSLMPLILIDAGMSIIIYNRYIQSDPWKAVLITQAIYGSIVIISFIFGFAFWYLRQKPLRDEALRLLADLEND